MDKRDGTIEIGKMESETCPQLKFYVDFSGFQEGSGSPCETLQEAEQRIKDLIKQHSENYRIRVINKLEQQKTL